MSNVVCVWVKERCNPILVSVIRNNSVHRLMKEMQFAPSSENNCNLNTLHNSFTLNHKSVLLMSIWPEKTLSRLWKNKFPLKTDLFDFILYNLQIRHLPMNKTNLISKAIEKPFSFIFFPTKFLCFYIDTGEKDVENSLNDPLKRRKYICIFFVISTLAMVFWLWYSWIRNDILQANFCKFQW